MENGDVGRKMTKNKWDWAGHVNRMQSEKYANVTNPWLPEDRRRQPRRRSRNDLDVFKKDWWEGQWAVKNFREAFIQQWNTQ